MYMEKHTLKLEAWKPDRGSSNGKARHPTEREKRALPYYPQTQKHGGIHRAGTKRIGQLPNQPGTLWNNELLFGPSLKKNNMATAVKTPWWTPW